MRSAGVGTAADRPGPAELGRRRGGRRDTASRRTTQMYAVVVAVDAQHLDVPVAVEPVRHRAAGAGGSPPRPLDPPGVGRLSPAAVATPAAAQRRPERPAELQRHDVVQNRVDHGADVVEDAGRVEEHRLECLAGAGALLDVVWTGIDRDQSLCVERSPTDEESNHHRH